MHFRSNLKLNSLKTNVHAHANFSGFMHVVTDLKCPPIIREFGLHHRAAKKQVEDGPGQSVGTDTGPEETIWLLSDKQGQ